MQTSNDQRTNTVDVYAFAMCCVEIVGMGELPGRWTTKHPCWMSAHLLWISWSTLMVVSL